MQSRIPAVAPEFRSGQVFWAQGFPTIEGGAGKARFVVIISPQAKLTPQTTEILVVGISSSTTAPDRIWLPNAEESPGCSTGLLTRC